MHLADVVIQSDLQKRNESIELLKYTMAGLFSRQQKIICVVM